MPSGALWVSTSLLSVSAASLGRLVADISNPELDYQDTSRSSGCDDGPEATSAETTADSFYYDSTATKSWGISIALTTILMSQLAVARDEVVGVGAAAVTTKTLLNSTLYFKEACKQAVVRDLLESRWRSGKKIFLTTGVTVVRDAHITIHRRKQFSVTPRIGLPGSVVIMAASQGAVPSLGGAEQILDSEVAVTRSAESNATSSFSFPGDNVIAVQYRRVGFSWFRKPSASAPTLKDGAEWKVYVGSRGDGVEPDAGGADDNGEQSDEEEGTEEDDDDDGAGYGTLRAQFDGDIEIDDLSGLTTFTNLGLEGGGGICHDL